MDDRVVMKTTSEKRRIRTMGIAGLLSFIPVYLLGLFIVFILLFVFDSDIQRSQARSLVYIVVIFGMIASMIYGYFANFERFRDLRIFFDGTEFVLYTPDGEGHSKEFFARDEATVDDTTLYLDNRKTRLKIDLEDYPSFWDYWS